MNRTLALASTLLLLAACGDDSSSSSSTFGETASATGTASGGTASASGTAGSASGTMSAGSASASGTASATETNGTMSGGTMSGGTMSGGTMSGGTMSGGTMSGGSDTGTSGATGGSTGGVGSGGSTGGMIEPCDTAMATLQPIPPNIVLVLDKSGSMVAQMPTRWSELYSVVDTVVNANEDKINFGAQLFPSKSATNTYTEQACVTSASPEVGVGPNNAASILAAIPAQGAGTNSIQGGTPASRGIDSAVAHLMAQDPENPRAIILITDGAANCQSGLNPPPLFEQYDSTVHTKVADAYNNNDIPTYVVGIDIQNQTSGSQTDGSPDNTNPWARLDQLANEGGTCIGDCANGGVEDFYQTGNQAELQMAMDQIVADAVSCQVPLNPQPPFPDLMEVEIGGMSVPKVMDCANEDGWVYVNPMGPYDAIELCGTWCDSLKMAGSLEAKYFCIPG